MGSGARALRRRHERPPPRGSASCSGSARSRLWDRVGWIYGTSAGALAGVMAATDRLAELEEFVIGLAPDESFRPNALWQLPLTGLHDYALPATIAERLAPIEALARDVAAAPIELVVCVTDVSDCSDVEGGRGHAFERAYSSRTAPPEVMASRRPRVGRDQRARAAAARRRRDRHRRRLGAEPPARARLRQPPGPRDRRLPVRLAYPPPSSPENLVRLRRRLEPFRAVPPVRALIGSSWPRRSAATAASRRTSPT